MDTAVIPAFELDVASAGALTVALAEGAVRDARAASQGKEPDAENRSEYSVSPVQVGRTTVCPLVKVVAYGPLHCELPRHVSTAFRRRTCLWVWL